jgi:hypothetical protein
MTTISVLPGPVMPGPRDDEVTAAAQNILIRAQRDDWPEKPICAPCLMTAVSLVAAPNGGYRVDHPQAL